MVTDKMRLFVLCIALVGHASAGEIILRNTNPQPGGFHKTTYVCRETISTITYYYTVNLTLSRESELVDTSDTEIQTSGPTWYILRNEYPAYPPDSYVHFSLRYRGDSPKGNCTWSFEPEDHPETTSVTPTSTSVNASTQEVTTETSTSTSEQTTSISSSSTAAGEITTFPAANETCLCACPCQAKSADSIEALMQSIIFELTIAKNSTYLSKQKYISASDKRWLSRGIGCVGILVLTLVFGSVVAGDLKRFAEHAHSALKRIKGL